MPQQHKVVTHVIIMVSETSVTAYSSRVNQLNPLLLNHENHKKKKK